MTIRIIDDKPRVHKCGSKYWHVRGEGEMVLAGCDTLEEAEQAKRAFEQVLLPRFTRDEAIAIIREAISGGRYPRDSNRDLVQGARLALEALAAAGAFSDGCLANCGSTDCPDNNMADKLDAAGIK